MLKYRGVVGTLKTLRRRGVFELSVFELAGFYCISFYSQTQVCTFYMKNKNSKFNRTANST
jgi:hypothetical protein